MLAIVSISRQTHQQVNVLLVIDLRTYKEYLNFRVCFKNNLYYCKTE